MAEVLGIVGSVIGIAAVGTKLAMKLSEYGSTMRHAHDQIGTLANEMTMFALVLEEVGVFLETAQGAYSKELLNSTARITKECKSAFGRIRRALKRARRRDDGGRFRTRRVSWLFNKPKTLEMKTTLEGLKSTLMLMMQTVSLAQKASLTEIHSAAIVEKLQKEFDLLKSLIMANNKTVLDLEEGDPISVHASHASKQYSSQPQREYYPRYRGPSPPSSPSRSPSGASTPVPTPIVRITREGNDKRTSQHDEISREDNVKVSGSTVIRLPAPDFVPSRPPEGVHVEGATTEQNEVDNKNDANEREHDPPDTKYEDTPANARYEESSDAESSTSSRARYDPQQFNQYRPRQIRYAYGPAAYDPYTRLMPYRAPDPLRKARVGPVVKLLQSQIPQVMNVARRPPDRRRARTDQRMSVYHQKARMTESVARITARLLLDKWTTAGAVCLGSIGGEGVKTQGERATPANLSGSSPQIGSVDGGRSDAFEDENSDDSDESENDDDFGGPEHIPPPDGQPGPPPPPRDSYAYPRPRPYQGTYGYAPYGPDLNHPPRDTSRNMSDEWYYREIHDRTRELDNMTREHQGRVLALERSLESVKSKEEERKRAEEERAMQEAFLKESKSKDESVRVFNAWELAGASEHFVEAGEAEGDASGTDLLERLESIGKGDIVWKQCSAAQESFFVGPRPYFRIRLMPEEFETPEDGFVSAVEIGREWVHRGVLDLFGYKYQIKDAVYRIEPALTLSQLRLLVRNSFQLTLNHYARNAVSTTLSTSHRPLTSQSSFKATVEDEVVEEEPSRSGSSEKSRKHPESRNGTSSTAFRSERMYTDTTRVEKPNGGSRTGGDSSRKGAEDNGKKRSDGHRHRRPKIYNA